MDNKETGKHIALLRKERGFTQESLAEMLSVSPQAVSKWENGHSLPETALLPGLARALDCSIDNILLMNSLQILEAVYGDGLENENVTRRMNRLVEDNSLVVTVDHLSMASNAAKGRNRYLLVKFQNDSGVSYCVVSEGDELYLDSSSSFESLPSARLKILAASYGNESASNDVMDRIKHLDVSDMKRYRANHTYFPSVPTIDNREYLTIVYANPSGIHVATCAEGEELRLNREETELVRETGKSSGSHIIRNVEELPGFGKGMDCTWAGALTTALKSMGENVSYVKVMGVSGACWRIAFMSPTWDYSSADALVVYDHANPGYRALGYTPVFAERVDKEDRAIERQKIVTSIKHDRPVLGINLRVAHEWGVICGYRDNGNELLCRTYYDKIVTGSPDFDNEPGTEEKYLFVDNWPFILTYFSQKGNVPTDHLNFLNSLKILIHSMNSEGERGYASGYRAYEAWQRDLRDDEWYKKAGDEQFGRRLDVNYFCFMALCDARSAASRYLQSSIGLIDNPLPGEMAVIYEEMSDKLNDFMRYLPAMDTELGGKTVGPEEMRNAWTGELRHRQAELFDDVIVLEKKGEELARKLVHL